MYLDLPETDFSNSRIYNSQVVEIRDDLSLIILMSTADEVKILSTPSNHSLTSFIYLPVYIFEVCKYLEITITVIENARSYFNKFCELNSLHNRRRYCLVYIYYNLNGNCRRKRSKSISIEKCKSIEVHLCWYTGRTVFCYVDLFNNQLRHKKLF
jgi:hypothetical protein